MDTTKTYTDPAGTLWVERFSPTRRAEHWLSIVSFLILVVTGFPQKFSGTSGVWLLNLMGGLDVVRFIHRVCGLVFATHAVLHIGTIILGLASGRMRPSLVPVPQDLRDAWRNLGYFLGFWDQPARLPKFDYRQKFEYMGLILGGMVMIVSGAVLMFPTLTATWLPGQVIPAARLAHSNEALLAFLVLAVWHAYGAVLSPEVFPLDTSIFTGYITAHELKERHPLEYERLFPGAAMGGTQTPAAVPSSEPAPNPGQDPQHP